MEIDTDRIDDAVLALLLLGLHDGCRTWKGFDLQAMEPAREGDDFQPRGPASRGMGHAKEGTRGAELTAR